MESNPDSAALAQQVQALAATPDEQNLELLREVRREMDELRNALKEKTDRSVDKMVRAMDLLFTTAVLECPVPSKFCLP